MLLCLCQCDECKGAAKGMETSETLSLHLTGDATVGEERTLNTDKACMFSSGDGGMRFFNLFF